MTRPTIVFDLDGTLADTAPDLYGTVCYLLAKEGRPSVPFARMKEFIGDGAGPMIMGSFGDTGGAPEGDDYKRLLKDFLDYYVVHLADRSQPFPEALGAIHRWKARGALIAICTNKKIEFAEKQLAAWRIRHLFDAVKGADSYPFRKPDGRHLTETIRAAGGDPACAVMIGDSASDTGAARNAGVPVIAVSFGYGRTPAHELDADRVIDSFIQLDRAAMELMGL
ncbi:MAG: HAD hydrolase-like protein [Minwuia sp.]|uniref:HAD hydrolase-like protein n=1 Tax=Minwuia sp. TaxID=2493630 RepID=UPI003A88B400